MPLVMLKLTNHNSHQTIPRAAGLPIIGQSLKAVRDPLNVLKELSVNYGSVVKIRLGLKDYYVLQSPEGARHVLQTNARNYCKPGAAKLMKRVLGNGLATANGEQWLRNRKLMQPAFHKQYLPRFHQILDAEISSLVETWRQNKRGEAIDVGAAFFRLTLNNLTKAMFGIGMEKEMSEIEEVLNIMLQFSSRNTKSLIKIPLYLPTANNQRFLAAEQRFEKVIHTIIQRRTAERKDPPSAHRNDLLDLLIDANEADSHPGFDTKQLRDEITTIFMAGHETTSQTLSWAFYQLALQPILHQKIKEESKIIAEDNLFYPSSPSIYTSALILETMRFYPPVWIIARKVIATDNIEGYAIPAGSTLLINVFGLHHHSRYWQSSDQFDPERFCNVKKEDQSLWHYLPFGGGQRVCIGRHFAMMVMETVILRLVQQFSFAVPAGFSPKMDANLVLRSSESIQLIVQSNNDDANSHYTAS
ncbi:MAG: cytochrome P450 [Chitinophagaceae bacterium]|nr:MAG: cytochrome P450 [Chitinophagaceae bacterium]